MESSVYSLSGSSTGSATLGNYSEPPLFQGSSELDSNTTSSTPAAPIKPDPAAVTDQAAQLRALLASHLTSGTGAPDAGANRSLEELLDVLYSMTAPVNASPAETNPVSPSPVQASASVSTGKVADAPAPANVTESPAAATMAAVPALEAVAPVERSFEDEPERIYTFAPPAITNARTLQPSFHREPTANTAPVPEPEQPVASLPLVQVTETAPPLTEAVSQLTEETPVEAVMPAAEASENNAPLEMVETAQSAAEPDIETTPEEPIAEMQAALVLPVEEVTESPSMSVEAANDVEMLAPEDTLAITSASNVVEFSFATEKSNAKLQIPVLPNLSLLVLEQRADEMIIKIHLAL